MKRYKDFKILCEANQSPIDLLNVLQPIISTTYKCERYTSFVKNDCLSVEINYSKLPSAKIILLATSKPDCVSIVNVIPSAHSELFRISIKEYNAIIDKFRDSTILPCISHYKNNIEENNENYTITEVIPKSYVELDNWLKQYPLSRHPSDEERWYDFLISLIDNNEFLSSDDLSKYIKESYNWNEKDIDNLIERYEDQIGLLQRYYAIHKQY